MTWDDPHGKRPMLWIPAGMEKGKDGKPVVVAKWASAHDLRRSFGERWAGRLLPQQLMELMRHESLTTTLTFYVGKNADRTADAVYEAFHAAEKPKGNTLGNSGDSEAVTADLPNDATRCG